MTDDQDKELIELTRENFMAFCSQVIDAYKESFGDDKHILIGSVTPQEVSFTTTLPPDDMANVIAQWLGRYRSGKARNTRVEVFEEKDPDDTRH